MLKASRTFGTTEEDSLEKNSLEEDSLPQYAPIVSSMAYLTLLRSKER